MTIWGADMRFPDSGQAEITGADIAAALERVAKRLVDLQDLLNSLDAAIGDGDCGLTTVKSATGLQQYLASSIPIIDVGRWLIQAGAAYNRAAPSTMGALIATAFMRAGKEAIGRTSIDAETLAKMLLAASIGIQERGKARPGDKTILDALNPAAIAFSRSVSGGADLDGAGLAALIAAREGRDAAIQLRSKVGRANWVGERTVWHPDPGTVLFVSALEAVLGADLTEPGSTSSSSA